MRVYNITKKRIETITAYETLEHNENYAANIVENTYLDEIKDFISYVQYGTEPRWSIQKDYYVLDLIDKIEAS